MFEENTGAGRPDPVQSARQSGLRYILDDRPGIRRRKAGKGFAYYDPEERIIRDRETLARIRALAIPPAWTEVWINPAANGHLQATGRDARGRKQYRYHPRWSQIRGETKYHRMIAFAEALPRIRTRVSQDLRRPGLPRRKVLATVVHLLDRTGIRIGNEEYRRSNESFGLSTLQDEHVSIEGATLHFQFRGKSGACHEIKLRDRRLAQIVRRSRDLPGSELFQYVNGEGERQTIDSGDVNDYLREIAEGDFSTKDFRTWVGTLEAALALQDLGPAASPTEAKRNVVAAVKQAAGRLRNRPATCRKHYVHPAVIEAYLEGEIPGVTGQGVMVDESAEDRAQEGLYPEEQAIKEFLEHRAQRESAAPRRRAPLQPA
ncbi:MAG: DNA topoisomerase IB [Candidatus Zixiibacteriota bacterium]|nr:MAG: DNA topoisomerase IB [candidate division Zixibacteria bacterium]